MLSSFSREEFKQKLALYRGRSEEAIKKNLPCLGKPSKDGGTALSDACEYALLNGGKRFRPSLVYMIADALPGKKDVSCAAMAIEFFHTASLIADDLPCMDNDDERRNKPSTHKVFGEATALLASYALIAAGYGLIASAAKTVVGDVGPVVIEALSNASENAGVFGLTGGQFLDINPPDLSLETLREVLRRKTVSLFEASFVFGWLFGGGDLKALPLVKQCASNFGMAFQIADDIGDLEQDKEKGRTINMALAFGVDAAKEMLDKEVKEYKEGLRKLKIDSPELLFLGDVVK
ncbi:MAG: polyprenyl synthetase family protein [Parachlamydiaceae bacterium]